jgi:hypothetical protein
MATLIRHASGPGTPRPKANIHGARRKSTFPAAKISGGRGGWDPPSQGANPGSDSGRGGLEENPRADQRLPRPYFVHATLGYGRSPAERLTRNDRAYSLRCGATVRASLPTARALSRPEGHGVLAARGRTKGDAPRLSREGIKDRTEVSGHHRAEGRAGPTGSPAVPLRGSGHSRRPLGNGDGVGAPSDPEPRHARERGRGLPVLVRVRDRGLPVLAAFTGCGPRSGARVGRDVLARSVRKLGRS